MKTAILIFAFAVVVLASANDKVKTEKPDYTKVKVVEHADNSNGGFVPDQGFYRPSNPNAIPESGNDPIIVPDYGFYRPSDPNATPESGDRPVPGAENPKDKYPYRPTDGVGRNGK